MDLLLYDVSANINIKIDAAPAPTPRRGAKRKAPEPAPLQARTAFCNDDAYAAYLRANVRVGQKVAQCVRCSTPAGCHGRGIPEGCRG